ncbi:DUF3263 domain-containing protein [Microbacterium sp. NIBRBAC000506063]|uniref:DUF3263 domain-containing protein n=1 Tax=Microbacterium sp. NIBRBAC000506063 TaxID=2734618 RepID=UPI001BB4C7EB|nr:DUF3263 domain-containing protein [Microbacterium sp. NIBRBAC000506063]QTV79461.1 DUF3263 domain-containing protein [Microbacterium sp. NIBRBAC000506063]
MTEPRSPRPTVPQLIDFAATHAGRFNGTVDLTIRAELGITPARYFQLLNRAIDTTEALQHDPVTTNRLRRERDRQVADRAARLH